MIKFNAEEIRGNFKAQRDLNSTQESLSVSWNDRVYFKHAFFIFNIFIFI
jgi:hypothetical protein